MQTRIKVTEKANGEKIYMPQFRGFSKTDVMGKIAAICIPIFGWFFGLLHLILWDDLTYCDGFTTEAGAKECIDEKLKQVQTIYDFRKANKTKKISYLKYP